MPKRTKHIQMRESVGPVWLSKSSWGADSIWPQLWFQANGPKLLPFAALAMPPRARDLEKSYELWHVMTSTESDHVIHVMDIDGSPPVLPTFDPVNTCQAQNGTEWHRHCEFDSHSAWSPGWSVQTSIVTCRRILIFKRQVQRSVLHGCKML